MQLIYADNPGSVPALYQLPSGLDLTLATVSAQFNGGAASGPFLACLSVYSQDDKLIGRFFPAQPFLVGDSGEITYATALPAGSGTVAGTSAQVSKIVSAATTNATVAKASPGVVVGWAFGNLNAATRYLKLYNKATAPTVGTDIPIVTMPLPPLMAGHVGLPSPIAFSAGISYALVTGIADNASGAVAANELTISLFFI